MTTTGSSSRGPSGPSGPAGTGTGDSIAADFFRRAARATRFGLTLLSGLVALGFAAISSVSTLVNRLTCASKLASRSQGSQDEFKRLYNISLASEDSIETGGPGDSWAGCGW